MNTLSNNFDCGTPITVEQYHRMSEKKILPDGVDVELIRGEIRKRPRMGPAGIGRIIKLPALFSAAVGERALVAPRIPLILDEVSEARPSVVVLHHKENDDYYDNNVPTAADVILVVEISEMTAGRDMHDRFDLYAHSGIPEVWVLDLSKNTLDVFHAPVHGKYTHACTHSPSDTIEPILLRGVTIEVCKLFRKRRSNAI